MQKLDVKQEERVKKDDDPFVHQKSLSKAAKMFYFFPFVFEGSTKIRILSFQNDHIC